MVGLSGALQFTVCLKQAVSTFLFFFLSAPLRVNIADHMPPFDLIPNMLLCHTSSLQHISPYFMVLL